MKLQLIRPGSPAIYACKKNNIPSLVFYYIAEQDPLMIKVKNIRRREEEG